VLYLFSPQKNIIEFSQYSGINFHTVDIAKPEVLIGGLIGTMMIFLFAGLAIAAVGSTAEKVVEEVRRQLKETPGIMTRQVKPDYQRCVAIVTDAALKEMVYPGCLAVIMPVVTGLIFRALGDWTNKPLLGAEVLAGYLMFATTCKCHFKRLQYYLYIKSSNNLINFFSLILLM
jgi:Na+/H+-translocating membrane pyrophosphatase